MSGNAIDGAPIGQRRVRSWRRGLRSRASQARRRRLARIFVALAAYCEPELNLTIQDLIEQADHPERLRFGVCLQYDDDGEPQIRRGCLDKYLTDDRFRIDRHDHRESRGGCWARHLTQGLYGGEEYTLQVDAHSRFVQGWDTELIEMSQSLPSAKPLITGFPPLYFREHGRDVFRGHPDLSVVPTTVIEDWTEQGWIHHPTKVVPANQAIPRRTRVLSGAFIFALGGWNVEVRQDPLHVYAGEEFALTLRSYTSGYDLFNPTSVVLWHRNHPQPNRKYITDFPPSEVRERHEQAWYRLRTLLAGDPDRELEPYSLGRERTLEDYRLFSGLDCAAWTIHPDARNGVPPDPVTLTETDELF